MNKYIRSSTTQPLKYWCTKYRTYITTYHPISYKADRSFQKQNKQGRAPVDFQTAVDLLQYQVPEPHSNAR